MYVTCFSANLELLACYRELPVHIILSGVIILLVGIIVINIMYKKWFSKNSLITANENIFSLFFRCCNRLWNSLKNALPFSEVMQMLMM